MLLLSHCHSSHEEDPRQFTQSPSTEGTMTSNTQPQQASDYRPLAQQLRDCWAHVGSAGTSTHAHYPASRRHPVSCRGCEPRMQGHSVWSRALQGVPAEDRLPWDPGTPQGTDSTPPTETGIFNTQGVERLAFLKFSAIFFLFHVKEWFLVQE